MHIWGFSKVLAFVASLAAGLVYAALFRRVSGYVAAFGRRMFRARSLPNSTPASAAAEGALN
jgi:hypothetical protein